MIGRFFRSLTKFSAMLFIKAEEIMKTGIKTKDAYHVACAIYTSCDCFLTTDNRLLKYHTSEIQILNPIDFVGRLEED